jgi:hypothetical protein
MNVLYLKRAMHIWMYVSYCELPVHVLCTLCEMYGLFSLCIGVGSLCI